MSKCVRSNFTLYVVLFILLVIVGAVSCGGCGYGFAYPAYGYGVGYGGYPGYWV